MLAIGGMFKEVEETTNMVDTTHCCQLSTRNVCLVFMTNTFLNPLPSLAIMPRTLLFITTTKTLTYWHVAKQTKKC
jgi:hypothetical protein